MTVRRGRSRSWLSLVGIGGRAELGGWMVSLLLIGTAVFGAVAGPRWLRDAEERSLARAVEQAPIGARQLVVRVLDDDPGSGSDEPLAPQRRRLAAISAEFSDQVLASFGDDRFVADTARFAVVGRRTGEVVPDATASSPGLPTFLTFRVHPEIERHSRLLAGRRAAPSDRVVDGLAVVEFELTPESATELGWDIGDVVRLGVDPSDLVTRSFSRRLPDDVAAELVGLRELDDVGDRYWFADPRLHRPTVSDTPVGANVFAFAMVHPDQLASSPFEVDGHRPLLLEQRRDLDPVAVTLDSVDAILEGVLAIEASFTSQPALTQPGVVTGLRPVLVAEIGQRDAARSTLVLAAVAAIAVVLLTIGQLAYTAAVRRRSWITVARARGASRAQAVVAATFETVVLASFGAALGVGIASVVSPTTGTWVEPTLVGVTFGGAVLSAALVTWGEVLRPVTTSGPANARPARSARVGGILLVITAVAAVVTFRRRGVGAAHASLDPLALAMPVVVPLAVVFLARGGVPWLVRRLTRHGSRLGPGQLVGLRRVGHSIDATLATIAVTALALTIAALGVGVDSALQRGATDASWLSVGAPYRIDTRQPIVRDAVAAIPGATVAVSGRTRVNVRRSGETYAVNLVTTDVAALDQITSGTASDDDLPSSLTAVLPDGSIPVVASARLSGRAVNLGDRLDGLGGRTGQTFGVVAVRTDLFARDADVLVADRRVVEEVVGSASSFDSLAIDAPESARSEIEQIAASAGERVLVRSDVLAAQLDAPLSRAVRIGFLLTAGFVLALSLIALASVVVATARQRRRDVVVLGVLGARRREAVNAVTAELAPSVLTGTVIGTLVGAFVVGSFHDRLDLSAFAAGSVVSVRVEPVGLIVAACGVVASSVAVVGMLVRRVVTDAAPDVRRLDESP